MVEINYQITPAGIKAYEEYVEQNGNALPPLKEANLCVNVRYKDGEDEG